MSFDDVGLRQGAQSDPIGFTESLPEYVILDEVQLVPELFSALKLVIDRKRTPGRFVLTGSTNILLLPTLSDSLAGRMQIIPLHPLSQAELAVSPSASPEDHPPGFLDALFGQGFKASQNERLRLQLIQRIVAGGYPEALKIASEARRAGWYRDYLETIVQRDIRGLTRIRELDDLPRLLALAATQTAQPFNVSKIATSFQLSQPTIRNYLALLERMFLIKRLPAWHNKQLGRLTRMPKLHVCDTGLACALLNVGSAALSQERPVLGPVLETFVFQELQRQASWHEVFLNFSHFRDRDGMEVDLVIEQGAVGAVAGIEVKASATVTRSDFRGLRKLAHTTGKRFAKGVVLYDGEHCIPFGDRFYAVPICRLWEST